MRSSGSRRQPFMFYELWSRDGRKICAEKSGHPSIATSPSLRHASIRLTSPSDPIIVGAMTYPQSSRVPTGAPGRYHYVSRCVRRASLYGEDRVGVRSLERGRQWVENRLHALGTGFSVSLWESLPTSDVLGARSASSAGLRYS